jgi:hypothetical protein
MPSPKCPLEMALQDDARISEIRDQAAIAHRLFKMIARKRGVV